MYGAGVIGGVILVGLVLATCAWMAFGDEDPRWVRGAARNAGYVVVVFGALFGVVWALDGWGFI